MAKAKVNTGAPEDDQGHDFDGALTAFCDDARTLESLFSAIVKFDGDPKGNGDVLMLAHLGKQLAWSLSDRIDRFSMVDRREANHG